jgi:hypothetical protein
MGRRHGRDGEDGVWNQVQINYYDIAIQILIQRSEAGYC